MLKTSKRSIKLLARMATCGWLTQSALSRDLKAIGIRESGILLVHASLSRLGYVAGGTRSVLGGLRRALGPEGTLLLPAHSWEQVNAGLRHFDVRETRSCVGQIAEDFRCMRHVQRSIHPTHSVCAQGPDSGELLKDHELALTPCGENTPYSRLLEADGQILFLGAGLESNTCFHCLESLAGLAGLIREAPVEIELTDYEGRSRRREFFLHKEGILRSYSEKKDILVERGVADEGRIGKAEAILLHGRDFRDFVLDQIDKDTEWLLSH